MLYVKKWNVKIPLSDMDIRDVFHAEHERTITYILSGKSDRQINNLLTRYDRQVSHGVIEILVKLNKAHLVMLTASNLAIIHRLSGKRGDKIIKKMEKMYGWKKLLEATI